MENQELIKCVIQGDVWNDVANIITIIISIVNLFFVIYIYYKDKKERKDEKEKKYKYTWFEMIKIKDRVDNLNALNNKTVAFISDLCQSKEDSLEKRKNEVQFFLIKEVNDFFILEKNSFTDLLKCINPEKGKELAGLYNQYQDKCYNLLNFAVSGIECDCSELHLSKSKIIEYFYSLGFDLIR